MLNTHDLVLTPLKVEAGQEWRPEADAAHFVFIADGEGYFLEPARPQPVSKQQVLVFPHRTVASLRASQLGDLLTHVFQVRVEYLSGILSLSESYALDLNLRQKSQPGWLLPADHPVALLFSDMLKDCGESGTLRHRLSLMQVVGAFLQHAPVQRNLPASTLHHRAARRFEELVRQMPESEIQGASVADLAARCGCSQRHFTRLFQEHFGTSMRSKQMELRLTKARHLLSATDSKIISIALESGFRHLGLFNSMFKRRFGTTPSRWRLQSQVKPKKRRIKHLAVWAAMAFLGINRAHAAPDSVATVSTNTTGYRVLRYQLDGNTILPQEKVDRILGEYTGDHINLDQIKAAAGELQLAYRGLGFATVSVVLPAQSITNGTVKMKAIEGKLVEINITGNRYFSSNNIRRSLPSLATNVFLNTRWFQTELDAANASSDRQIYPMVGPGPEPGTTVLNLKVKDRLPLHGKVELNNKFTPGTPNLRIDSAVEYKNLWQLDHQVGIQYGFSPQEMKNEKLRAQWFYDQPLIANYSAFYRMPLTTHDNLRDTYATMPVDFGYDEVTRRFRTPAPTGNPEVIFYASRSTTATLLTAGTEKLLTDPGVKGEEVTARDSQESRTVNENLGARVTVPLPALGTIRTFVSGGFDFKHYHLNTLATNLTTVRFYDLDEQGNRIGDPEVTVIPLDKNSASSVYYFPLAYGWNAFRPDRRGTTSLSFNQNVYLQALSVGNSRVRTAASSSTAGGNFTTINMSFSREQKLTGEFDLSVRANGQWASAPVISNEQFGIGGTGGVRGYIEGEEYGDHGWRLTIEPKGPSVELGMVDGTLPMKLRTSLFLDYGQRYLIDPGASRKGRVDMLGTGISMTATVGEWLTSRLSVGWALLDTAATPSGTTRVYFGVEGQF